MYENIRKYCDTLPREFDSIPSVRKQLLGELAHYMVQNRREKKAVNLVYICTHNSRRSHFGQIWAKLAGEYYGVDGVSTYSGGTEATAFHPHAIQALKQIGFEVETTDSGLNPVYLVRYDSVQPPMKCFSKTYNDAANPASGFAAVMTCGEAETDCPLIPGAEFRIAITYEDPKAFDYTPHQDQAYSDRCRQIAKETFYVFSLVKMKICM